MAWLSPLLSGPSGQGDKQGRVLAYLGLRLPCLAGAELESDVSASGVSGFILRPVCKRVCVPLGCLIALKMTEAVMSTEEDTR